MEPDGIPRYLSLHDLSKISALSVKTLRYYLSDPELPLPHYRMPRKIIVNVQEFQIWFERFRVRHAGPDLNQLVIDLLHEIQ